MYLDFLFYFAWFVLAATTTADIGLHAAVHRSHLLVAPSFSGDAIELHPGLHPDHDHDDLVHLIPSLSHGLHWSQEGHRNPLHGAKHAHMVTTFNHPTVVLEHSNHIHTVKCQDDMISICFKSPQAMATVETSWLVHPTLNLITYHTGCGDESGRRRSFFEASRPVLDSVLSCITMPVTRVDERDAIDSGDLKWGTYSDPHERRRGEPILGHVRVSAPDPPLPDAGPLVDLTTNRTALKNFVELEFLGNGTDKPIARPNRIHPVEDEDELDFIAYNGSVTRRDLIVRSIESRGLFEWISGAVNWFVNLLVKTFKTIAEVITEVAKIVAEVALLAVDLIAVPFGFPFKRSYHSDIDVSYFRGGKPGKLPSLNDVGEGWVIGDRGADISLKCVKCGIEAHMIVNGELAFSMKEGITRGEVALENKQFDLHLIFGLELRGKTSSSIPQLKQQLGSVPLSPLAIPGIFTLGPQVSISVALSLVLEADVTFLIGGTAKINPGIARLSLVDKSRNKLEGFKAEFEPVAEANSGSITATADLGLPIAVEVGLDVLNGAFKKTVGLVNTPSVYLSAQYSKGKGRKCDNGVELRFGVKNRLYLAALGMYEYTLWDQKIFETGLTCVKHDGFHKDQVEDNEDVFKDIAEAFGGEQKLATNSAPKVDNVAKKLTSTVKGNEGFRIIMDEKETSVLVSGTDGFIYLVLKDNYDTSAPWGSLNITEEVVDFDVFGRVIGFEKRYMATPLFGNMIPLQVYDAKKMPQNAKVAALSVLQANGNNFDTYGASISIVDTPNSKSPKTIFYTTACEMKGKGLRLFLTRNIVLEHGKIRTTTGTNVLPAYSNFAFQATKTHPSKCRTVKLTSKLKGTAKKRELYP